MRAEPVQALSKFRTRLGEGSIWDDVAKTLYFVDIEGYRLYAWQPRTDKLICRDLEERPSTVVFDREHLYVAAGHCIYRLRKEELEDADIEPILRLPLKAGVRFNDGKCDPQGRLYLGTMALDESPGAGTLFLLSERSCEVVLDGVTISNGLAFDRKNDDLLYVDTPTRKLAHFKRDEKGHLTVSKSFNNSTAGYFDGMTMDDRGNLYIALWGGAAVAVYSPEGKLVETISVPAANVTSCAFGDDDLGTLYITTSTNDTDMTKYPDAGHVFSVRTGTTGLPADLCRIKHWSSQ